MVEQSNRFMDNVNLGPENSLTHLLDTDHNEQLNCIKHSSYYEADEFIESIATQQNGFLYMSLNCYSLNAKFTYVKLLIEKFKNKNCPIQALALQETWCSNATDLSLYNIPGYQMISVGHHASTRGGLVIVINNLD